MYHSLSRYCVWSLCAAYLSLGLGSCVDHDYDLSEDIDLTVNVGGQLITIPASNTEPITLSDILELDRESSIKEVDRQGDYGLNAGDYVLLQAGNSKPSEYKINIIDISERPSSTVEMNVPRFINAGIDRVTVHTGPIINGINLSDNNIDRQIVEVNSARMAVDMNFNVEYISASGYDGDAIIDAGFTTVFPDNWTVEVLSPSYLTVTDGHIVTFGQDVVIRPNAPFKATIRITAMDFENLPAGQGLYAPGHFNINSDITSEGAVSLLSSSSFPAGGIADLTLRTYVEITTADILEVTGVVNPDIIIERTSFEITDIPDFLDNNSNKLDIVNPRINLVVTNDSPLTLDVDGVLTAYKSGNQPIECPIGASYGTGAITVPPMSTTTFVISREPVPSNEYVNVVVSRLGDIINTIPDEIVFDNVNCIVRQTPVTFGLGISHIFNATYDAVIPLAFGPDMELHYTHEDDSWSDMEKYNFDTVEISIDAINSVPLFMVPSVTPLGVNSVDVEIEGVVTAGTPGTPSTSPVKITLRSKGGSLTGLYGIAIDFLATAKDPATGRAMTGVNLNAAQALKLNNITIRIIGGITIDLND